MHTPPTSRQRTGPAPGRLSARFDVPSAHGVDSADSPGAPMFTRRGFLKVGFGFSAALACTSLLPALSGCAPATETAAPGMAFLRAPDVALFRALIPAIVSELADVDAKAREARIQLALSNIDRTCASMGEHAQGELRKLLGLLDSRALRWALTGVGHRWETASTSQVQRFLARWRASRFATLNAGAVVLVKLASVGYYVSPAAWPGSGYPGPNETVYRAIHA